MRKKLGTESSAAVRPNGTQTGTRKPQGGKHTNGRPAGEEGAPPAQNFFNRLAQMSDNEWDKHKVYVYRRWPRISRDDQPHYIGTHRQAIDEEFVKGNYGSGRYLLKLNDPKRTIDFAPLEIQDLTYPPRLAADELVDCPRT
jgi:hypothetical protein